MKKTPHQVIEEAYAVHNDSMRERQRLLRSVAKRFDRVRITLCQMNIIRPIEKEPVTGDNGPSKQEP